MAAPPSALRNSSSSDVNMEICVMYTTTLCSRTFHPYRLITLRIVLNTRRSRDVRRLLRWALARRSAGGSTPAGMVEPAVLESDSEPDPEVVVVDDDDEVAQEAVERTLFPV